MRRSEGALDAAGEISRQAGLERQTAKDELSELEEFAMDGLLEREADRLVVNDTGKIFIRNIAMTFDAYLRKGKMKTQISRTV